MSKEWSLMLVNREHPLTELSIENRLVSIGKRYKVLLDKEAAASLCALFKDIDCKERIVPVSGYRSKEEQARIYKESLEENGEQFTRKYVMPPNCSEHQSGLAIDLALNRPDIDFIRPHFPYTGICGEFRKRAAHFGFIERYPKGKENITGIAHEPWHFRYVGVPHAQIMEDKGLTLEEYIDWTKTRTGQRDRAWIELDMGNLRHNISVLTGHLPPRCRLMAVVKADAYGHGAVAIAKELNACGISEFCVASVSEGVILREQGIRGEILIMGYTHPDCFYLLKKYGLTQTVTDAPYAKALNLFGEELHVHIKIDTGMRRLGIRSENIDELMEVFACENLVITGIYTHLCAADGKEEHEAAFTQKQIERFKSVLLEIEGHGYKRPKTHVQNSYALLRHTAAEFDCARVGTSMLGMLYTAEDTEAYGNMLRPVLSLKARVGAIKTLLSGETLGYGMAFTAPHDMRIAVLTIGYGDGIPRKLSCGVGHVLINGQKAPITGRICMDQLMVDITGIENVKQGDVAVIIGKCGALEISVCDIAEQAGTITPEIMCRLGIRLGRQPFRCYTDPQ